MPTAYNVWSLRRSRTGRLPPVDLAKPDSTMMPSSSRDLTILDIVASVSNDRRASSVRLISPSDRMTSTIALRVSADDRPFRLGDDAIASLNTRSLQVSDGRSTFPMASARVRVDDPALTRS
jgi:hypothetical protein